MDRHCLLPHALLLTSTSSPSSLPNVRSVFSFGPFTIVHPADCHTYAHKTVINGQRAALHAPVFAQKLHKTRFALLDELVKNVEKI